jgi:hypothetical protein
MLVSLAQRLLLKLISLAFMLFFNLVNLRLWFLANHRDIPDENDCAAFLQIGVLGRSNPFVEARIRQYFDNIALDNYNRSGYTFLRDHLQNYLEQWEKTVPSKENEHKPLDPAKTRRKMRPLASKKLPRFQSSQRGTRNLISHDQSGDLEPSEMATQEMDSTNSTGPTPETISQLAYEEIPGTTTQNIDPVVSTNDFVSQTTITRVADSESAATGMQKFINLEFHQQQNAEIQAAILLNHSFSISDSISTTSEPQSHFSNIDDSPSFPSSFDSDLFPKISTSTSPTTEENNFDIQQVFNPETVSIISVSSTPNSPSSRSMSPSPDLVLPLEIAPIILLLSSTLLSLKTFIGMCLWARQVGRDTKLHDCPWGFLPKPGSNTRFYVTYHGVRIPGIELESFETEPGTTLDDRNCFYGCLKEGKRQWLRRRKYVQIKQIFF